jgi:hypothetical protein
VGQYAVQSLFSIAHPVLGSIGSHPAPEAFWARLEALLFFIAALVLFRVLCAYDSRNAVRLNRWAFCIGSAVTFVGLSHWFYDTGKLFWLFEPDFLFVSERARWPFVNANHLGDFLLPVFFVLLARLLSRTELILRQQRKGGARQPIPLLRLLASAAFQRSVLKACFSVVLLIAVTSCILATLSRGAWFGLGLGILLFLTLEKRLLRAQPSAPQPAPNGAVDTADGRGVTRRHRRHRTHSGGHHPRATQSPWLSMSWPNLVRPALVVSASLLILFFLFGKGTELLEGRLEYGLMYSKDDMRWSFYADTFRMIKDHLWFGVGLGAWQHVYPKYMNDLLANVQPSYLHSDPLELLAETGVAGAVPIVAAVAYLGWALIRSLRGFAYQEGVALIGLGCGIFGLLASSLVDFPLRIPAVALYLALYVAVTLFYLDRARANKNA